MGVLSKWDLAYLGLAKYWAESRSKDPSTKVGAVIVSADGKREFLGYNGFPRGVHDWGERLHNRETKYRLVVHAEANAVIKAGREAEGGTIYTWPLFTCNECAKLIIQAGIARVVSLEPREERWQSMYAAALLMYNEAGVKVDIAKLDGEGREVSEVSSASG
jgi:dCMP deaminase